MPNQQKTLIPFIDWEVSRSIACWIIKGKTIIEKVKFWLRVIITYKNINSLPINITDFELAQEHKNIWYKWWQIVNLLQNKSINRVTYAGKLSSGT